MNENEILDPIVERTREAREALMKQYNYDLDRLMDLFKSMQAEHLERVRRPVSRLAGHAETEAV
jgi:hypothetical protein